MGRGQIFGPGAPRPKPRPVPGTPYNILACLAEGAKHLITDVNILNLHWFTVTNCRICVIVIGMQENAFYFC